MARNDLHVLVYRILSYLCDGFSDPRHQALAGCVGRRPDADGEGQRCGHPGRRRYRQRLRRQLCAPGC
jgi:hypothetical protein